MKITFESISNINNFRSNLLFPPGLEIDFNEKKYKVSSSFTDTEINHNENLRKSLIRDAVSRIYSILKLDDKRFFEIKMDMLGDGTKLIFVFCPVHFR